MPRRIGIVSRGIKRIANLRAFLERDGDEVVFLRRPQLKGIDCLAGWGLRESSRDVRAFCSRNAVPYLSLEDGFYRSVYEGRTGEASLSMIVDPIGTYYAGAPNLISETLRQGTFTIRDLSRARSCLRRIRSRRLSKYNPPRTHPPHLPDAYVLLCDQVADDASLRCRDIGASAFEAMLNAAAQEARERGVPLVMKAHPEAIRGTRQGILMPDGRNATYLPEDVEIEIVSSDVDPFALIEHAVALHVVSSQMGFEGLIAGTPVTTHAASFYSGLGLTRDAYTQNTSELRCATPSASLEELFCAACLKASRYVDPHTGRETDLERVLDCLDVSREIAERFASGITFVAMSPWKKSFLPDFCGSRSALPPTVGFARADLRTTSPEGVPDQIGIWGATDSLEGRTTKATLWRVEDGFLRSNGLGAELRRPLSLVFDDLGLHYLDEHQSRIERILAETDFDHWDIERARRLIASITQRNLTKYNLHSESPPDPPLDRKSILVVGQVEDDASVVFNGTRIKNNLALLAGVREEEPDAFIAYKAHPDVVAGLRHCSMSLHDTLQHADAIYDAYDIGELYGRFDEIHVNTSSSGFEAVIRGITPHVWGRPFYAGWGLTIDRGGSFPRRGRNLTREELVAGALIHYPIYVHPVSRRPCPPESALEALHSVSCGRSRLRLALGRLARRIKNKALLERSHRGVS